MIILYAFALPLSRAGIVLLSVLLLVPWAIKAVVTKRILEIFKLPVVKALLLFLFFNVLSLLWSEHLLSAWDYVLKYWYFLPLVVIATSLEKRYVSVALSAFVLGMFISEILSYGVFFEVWQFNKATIENPTPFMHHIEYSVFLAFTALLVLNHIFNATQLRTKILYSVFFITVSGNLFLTAGRTGQFAFIVGLFVLALVSFKNKIKALGISIILTGVILFVAFSISNTFKERLIIGSENLVNLVEKRDFCTSWGGRVGAWILSKEIILKSPILGEGTTDAMNEFHTLIDKKYPQMRCMHDSFMHVHNQYLQIFVQLGVIGLLLFIFMFYTIFTLEIKKKEYRNIKYIYLAVLLFSMIPEVLLHRQFNMALFAFVIGLLVAQNRIENEI